MRTTHLWAALAGITQALVSSNSNRDYATNDYYAVHLDSSSSPDAFASHTGLVYDGLFDVLPDHHIFRAARHDHDIVRDSIDALKRRRKTKRSLEPHVLDGVKYAQKQVLRKRLVKRAALPAAAPATVPIQAQAVAERAAAVKQLAIGDPIFNTQWHLFNTKEVGHDLNVTGVWLQGITGKGATVCLIDDGLDMDSLDLKANYFAAGSYDFNDHTDEPKPKLDDDQHGTRCAGEIAAVRNDVCGLGVAYDAHVSGVRILSAPISDIDEAAAVLYGFQGNDIYSCSWGPPDDGQTMDAPGILIEKAMLRAVQEGRHGKGSIYVFAAGNGAAADDNCNFDGYTNSIYSVTIGAIDKTDSHPYYSEACSAQIAVTYSSGSGDSIHTTDVGRNVCTDAHGGTSASGPLVAGVYALALEVRPDLTWRDIQWVTVMSTVPFYNEYPETVWQTTAIGRKFHHQLGYGKVDAYNLIEVAKTWQLVKKQAWYFSPWIHVRHDIPQGNQGLTSEFEITAQMLKDANLERVEHVTVTMNLVHKRRGDISVELHSPTGVVSYLSTARRLDNAAAGYVDWTFMTVAHFGETGIGKWTVLVKDGVINDNNGTFTDWRIKLYGECIDESIQGVLPMPTEDDDKDHDVEVVPGVVGTTSVTHETKPTPIVTTGHPVRPSIVKPTDASSPSATGNVQGDVPNPGIQDSSDNGNAGQPGTSAGEGSDLSAPPVVSGAPSEGLLPSPFPTFGVSKRTQIWIYGALALIVIFCVSLAAYSYMQRRRRLRNNPRDNYEFAMLDDAEETDGMLASGSKRGRRRRAGELYDAFAGESDDDLFSDEEDGGYRDADEQRFGRGGSSAAAATGTKSSQRTVKDTGEDLSDGDEKSGLV